MASGNIFLCSDECLGLSGREAEAEAVRDGRLLILEIEPENRCDLRCPFCRAPFSAASGRELSLAEWRNALTQGLALGVKHVLVGGRGEPLAAESTLPLLRELRDRGCSAELVTNGTRVTVRTAKELFALGVHVVVKWDSARPDVQDLLAGRSGAHARIFKGREHLLAAGYPGSGRRLGIKTAVTRHNIGEIPVLWRWARERGVEPYVWRSANGPTVVPPEEWAVDLKRAWDLFEELSGIDSRDFRSSWRTHPPWAARSCNRLPFSLAVRAEGTVTPCLGLDLPVGRVRDAGLGEIFSRSEIMDDLRDVRARVKGYCRICRKADVCYGCRASAYHHTGDHLASDPECWHRRIPDEGAKRNLVEGKIPQKGAMGLIRGWAVKDDLKVVLPLTVPGEGIFIAPDRTLAPVALIEMLAQHCAAGYAPQKEAGHDGQLRGYIAGIDNVSFFRPVRSGDSLDLVICNIIEFNEIHRVQGEAFRGSALVGQAELTLIEVGEWKAPPPMEALPAEPEADPLVKRFRNTLGDKDSVGRGILDSLTRVCIRTGEMAEADLSFKPEFVAFQGHFPDYPVLPGVVILYLGWVVAEIFQNRRLDLFAVRKARFSRPIHPRDAVKVKLLPLKVEDGGGQWFSVSVACGGETAARCELGVRPSGEGRA